MRTHYIFFKQNILAIFLFLHKNIYCGYSKKHLSKALLMSTHNTSSQRNKENIYLDAPRVMTLFLHTPFHWTKDSRQ